MLRALDGAIVATSLSLVIDGVVTSVPLVIASDVTLVIPVKPLFLSTN